MNPVAERDATPSGADLAAGSVPDRIVLPPRVRAHEGTESAIGWGFEDTAFRALPNRSVVMTGDRYDLCGDELPSLVPWVEEQFGLPIDLDAVRTPTYPPEFPAARTNDEFLAELVELLPGDAISADPALRMRRGRGHTQGEIYASRYGTPGRIPDLVVFPASEVEVEAIMAAADRHGACLVPYGGGTNVSGALTCDPGEERMIVTVDMSRMDRVLWIDPTNQMACIEAGAVGADIVEQLAAHGFTLGHEPDSIEFSTLGGWIATHASGMKKNRYGNIEDIVLDVNVVTPRGTLSSTVAQPREAIGLDARRWIFGSEGTLGIVTSAIVKVFPQPEVQRYDAIIFRNFEAGAAFMYDLTRAGAAPASLRLMDNLQFQLGQTLKPGTSGLAALTSRLERWYVTKLKGFGVDEMAAVTLVYEGSAAEVKAQQAVAKRLARRHGGLGGGSSNGERGYQLTFAIAYLRDFVMDHWILGESFETSVSWSQAVELCDNVKRRMREEHAARGLPGRPFVTCRMTQVYDTGVCIYFYLAIPYHGVDDPSETYAELEHAARDEILRSGGSLSHHHGVGKHRQEFLPRVVSPATLACSRALKEAVDPADVLGIGNQRPSAGTGE